MHNEKNIPIDELIRFSLLKFKENGTLKISNMKKILKKPMNM